MALNLNDFKKSTTTPPSSAPKTNAKTGLDLNAFKKPEEKKEGLLKKVSQGIQSTLDVTSANLFSGVASTAGAVEEGLGKILGLGSKGAGYAGDAYYSGLGKAVGLFNKDAGKVLDQLGQDFKKNQFEFADLASETGQDVNQFLSQAGREAKDTILKDNKGYQDYLKRQAEEGEDAQKFEWKDLTSKDFLAYELYGSLIENAPTMVATLYTGGAVGASTKVGTVSNFLAKVGGSTLFSTGVNALRESESAYSQALDEGYNKDEARERANRVFERNSTGNLGLEALQMLLVFAPPLKSASPWLKSILTTGKYAGAGAIEAGQERGEDAIQNQAGNEDFQLGQFLEDVSKAGITKTDAISFLLGVGFQGMGNVMVDRSQLEKAQEQQVELIADKLPDDGKGGTAEERLERAIQNDPEGTEAIVREVQTQIRQTPQNIEQRAQAEQLRDGARQALEGGATPAQVALELSKRLGSVEAQSLVEEIVSERADRFVSRETPEDSTIAPPKRSTAGDETVAKLNDILDKTPSELQSDFNNDQKQFESTVADLRETVNDLKKKVAEAPDRSAVKKKLKTQLTEARKELEQGERSFTDKITEKAETFRSELADFVKNTPNVNLTVEQQQELVERVAERVTNPSLEGGISTSVRQILRNEYTRIKNPKVDKRKEEPSKKPANKPQKEEKKPLAQSNEQVEERQTKKGTLWTNKAGIEKDNKDVKEGDTVTFNGKQWTVGSVLELQSDTKYELIPAEEQKNTEKDKKPEKKTQKDAVAEFLDKEGVASIKDVADATGILVPNIRRILGVGAKEGEFERVDDGVYRIKGKNGEDVAVVIPKDAVETLPKLAKEGFKADMVFLDIPYDTPAVKGGNRGVNYNLLSVEDFGKVLDAVNTILKDANSPVIHFYSQAPSGLKAMQKYNDLFVEKKLIPVAKGEYQKTFKDGKPVTSPNGKVAKPEGILVFTQSGQTDKQIDDLQFKLVRPKGYQTEKPAEMLSQLIEMTTDEGDVVLDPFAGSGVTGAEAVKKGRKAVLLEKDEKVAKEVTKPRVEEAVKETKKKPEKKEEVAKDVLTGEKLLSMNKKEIAPLLIDRLNIVDEGGKAIQKVGTATPLKSFDLPRVKQSGGLMKLAESGVFTDSFVLINDKAESKKLLDETKKRTERIESVDREVPEWERIITKDRSKAKIQGYVVEGTFQPRVWTALTDGDVQMFFDTDKLAYVMKAFPDAEMSFTGYKKPLVFEQDGEVKALVMPVNLSPKGNQFAIEKAEDIAPVKTKIKKSEDTIADTGEKIGGARKDLFQKQQDKYNEEYSNNDILAMKLSEALPALDYQNLLDNGVSEEALAIYTYGRSRLGNKPTGRHQRGKRERWVQGVMALREVGQALFVGGDRMNEVIDRAMSTFGQVERNIEFYKALDFINEPAVRNYTVRRAETSTEEVFIVQKNGRDASVRNADGRWARSIEEAVANTKRHIEETSRKGQKKGELDVTDGLSVFRRGAEYLTAYKKGSRFVEFEVFANLQDAREARQDKEAIQRYQKQLEELVNFDKNSFRVAENKVADRSYRTGDVGANDFMDEFGFRGVEFGNWVNQSERQERLNFAYDALKDLATILEIPSKAISLNGELGFAFGSRGRKGALAHYEPDKVVINLTKENGSGTIAHEWWHALDNYLARRNGDKTQFLTETLRYERTEVKDAFYDLMTSIAKSDLYKRSQKADKIKGRSYFTNRTELGARAFEVYVSKKLRDRELQNDYLVNLKDTTELTSELNDVYPYAVGEEVAMVTEKLDKVFDELQVESSPAQALYSLKEGLNLTPEQGNLQAEMLAVLMDMRSGALTEAEAQAQMRPLWTKAKATLTKEQLAILDVDARFQLKQHDQNNSQLEERFKFLNEIKKRWGIDFDVFFVDTILAGIHTDKLKNKSFVEAWGAYADNSIAIARDALENTDRHEVVHLTLDNAYRIPIMQKNGITKEKVLRAQAEEMGIDFDKTTRTQRVEIEEEVAKNFENYRNDKYTPKGILRKFFVLLKRLIAQARGMVNRNDNIVRDYYDLLEEGTDVNAQMAFFENQGLLKSYITDGTLDLRGSKLAVNFDEAPATKKLTVTRLKKKEGDDAYLQKVTAEYNKVASEQEALETNTEKWKADLDQTIQKKADLAEEVGQTPEQVKELRKNVTKTPPPKLTEAGKAKLDNLEFANEAEAEAEIRAYMERKTELVETRNRLRTIRKDIAQARKLGKENRGALRDIERRLKARKQYLERKDRHKKIGRNEQMRMIARRGRVLREMQDFIGLSDSKAKDLIGGIGRQRIHTMTEKEFNDFMIKFVNQGTDITNRLDAQDSVRALIQEMQFQNEDNVRKALKLPTIAKMSQAQAEQFYRVLEQYELGDKFLTQRQLETIHRTQWGDARTEREMHARIEEATGITREDLEKVEVQSDIQKFKNWLVLSRSNPMFAWLVDRRIKAKIQQKAELVAFEKELNPLVNKARKSRERGIKGGLINALAPSDEVVFDYIENENKEEFAKEKQMTQAELDLAHFLMGRLFEPARQYMTTEYAMNSRDNYITHIRRDIVETFFDAVREGRGAVAGTKDAIREILTSQKETEQQFKILAGKTGEVVAFEKFFQFAMPRTGELKPTKNVARASLAYASAYYNKKALDELVPEVTALVKVQEQIKGYTERGLPKDPTVKQFVDQFLNDAKGRKIEFITQQGSALDSALKLGVAWTAFKYLGFRPLIGMVNFIGEFVGTMRATTTVEKWRGISRTLNLKKAHRVHQAHQYFTGRNPLVELFDPQHGVATRIKNTAMVLFSLSTYFNNQFYLRAKMTKAEWEAEVMQDERTVEIVKEMSKWRNGEFYVKSLAGNTATGSVFNQFATWAVPIVTTTMSDTHQILININKRNLKENLTSEEIKSFGKTFLYLGTIAMIANMIKQGMDVDEDDRDIWFYITRELNTLMGAFETVWNFEGRAPILRDIINLQKLIIQTLTAEKYKADGEGYGIGDWKARVTGQKLVEPVFIRDFREMIKGEPEREDTKERLIQEAIESGEEPNPDEILNFVSPDEWNNVEGKRDPAEQVEYQEKKRGEIMALYHLRKTYPESTIGQIVLDENNNDDRIAKMVEYAQEVGVDTAYAELQDLYKDKKLCSNTKDKTGCLVSGQLYKGFQKAKRDLQ